MKEKLEPKKIKELWSQVNADYDSTLGIPEAVNYYIENTWQDCVALPLFESLKKRFEVYPEFFCMHNYDWTLEKEAYDFTDEILYQTVALDTALGIWRDAPEDKKNNPIFKNLCVRKTTIWSFQDATPRAVKAQDIRFVVLPYAWEDIVPITIEGFLKYTGYSDSETFSEYLTRTNKENSIQCDSKAAQSYWISILAKTVAGEFDCPDVLLPEFVKSLMEETDTTKEGILYIEAPSNMTTLNSCAKLASTYAIAHEIGHHTISILNDPSILSQEEVEISADHLAFNGLWNTSSGFYCYNNLGLSNESMCLVSGNYFMVVIGLAHYTIKAWDLSQNESTNSEVKHEQTLSLWKNRFRNWITISEQLAKGSASSELVNTFINLQPFTQNFLKYLKEYENYALSIFPRLKNKAPDILKRILSNTPHAYNKHLLSEEIRRGRKEGALDPPPPLKT